MSDLVGRGVRNPEGDSLGRVEDVVVDLESRRMVYAVCSFGGFLGNRLFAIPAASFVLGDDGMVVLHADEQKLDNAPGFDRDRWPSMADHGWQTAVHQHFGQTPYWTRT